MRRLAIVAHYDRRGVLGGYVDHFVEALRPHVERVVLVVNGSLRAEDRARAEVIFDAVSIRDNSGFDVYAYRDGFAAERERAAQVDEVLLLNTTFYAPLHDLADLFERMSDPGIDLWGITSHPEVRPNPITQGPVMHRHLQTYWLGIRRALFTAPDWDAYWESMPPIERYLDAVQHNEVRFTHYFESRGFRTAVAFPTEHLGVENATMEAPDVLLDMGCPIVKRRLFFHDPVHFEQHALVGRDVRTRMERLGFPMELVWEDANHQARPRYLHANMSMLDILPEVDTGGASVEGLRIGVLAHVFYTDMTDELLDMADRLPHGYTLIATTTTEEKRQEILAVLERRGREGDEVRVVASNRGRDITAFLIGLRDVLRSDRFDVVVKLHTKRSPQDSLNRGRMFRGHLFDNLLHSPGYVANVLRLFVDHPSLGMAFPPMVHIGYPTLGRAWFTNREPAQRLADELGIDVVFDDVSPVAAYGSMFWARPAALGRLIDADFDWSDFPDEGGYADGGMAHVVERLFAYAALDAGYEVRTIMTTERAAASHTSLDFKLQEMLQHVPGELPEQIAAGRRHAGGATSDSVVAGLRVAGRSLARRNRVTARLVFEGLRAARAIRSRVRGR